MDSFEYYTPTKIVFGRDAENKAGKLAKEFGFKKALIHYGGERVKNNGLLQKVCAALESCGIEWTPLGGVVPNPRLSKIREGIEICKAENVDFILAVGGGSVIDSAKAIGLGLANGGDVWDFYSYKRKPQACTPVGVVLTISAAGSEMSESSVITNEDGGLKRGCSAECTRPKFAMLNPELTLGLPQFETACGCVDILMHTFERYFTCDTPRNIIDSVAEGICRTVIQSARILQTDSANLDARADVMWAGSLSHNGLTGGRQYGDWSCHQLEHELSGMFDVAHGAGLAAIWSTWAKYVVAHVPARFAQFARNVMQVNPTGNDNTDAANGIDAFDSFLREIGMPTKISELGINLDETQIAELARKCSFDNRRKLGEIMELDTADMANIYRLAK